MLREAVYVLVPGGRDRGWKDSVCTSASQGPGLSRLQRGAARQQKTELFCQGATCPGEMQEHGRGARASSHSCQDQGLRCRGQREHSPALASCQLKSEVTGDRNQPDQCVQAPNFLSPSTFHMVLMQPSMTGTPSPHLVTSQHLSPPPPGPWTQAWLRTF